MEQEVDIILDLSKRFFVIATLFVLAALLAALGFFWWQHNLAPQNAPHEISVSGEGKAYAKPDVAVVSFGVTTQALKSQDAVDQNNQKMNIILDAVKKQGVAEADIQTTGYNLSPWYDYTDRGSVFKGYQLNQEVTVKIRNFDTINAVLDAATS